MAGEEENELRDLVAQTLEAKGILGKIRAELRSNVFLVLEEQEKKKEGGRPLALRNQKLQLFLATKDGQAAAGLVREFLEFFNLDFSCAVFDPETNVLDTYSGRERLAREVGVDGQQDTPLLLQVLKRPEALLPDTQTTPTTTPTSSTTTTVSSSNELRLQVPPHLSSASTSLDSSERAAGSKSEASKQISDELLKISRTGNEKPAKEGSSHSTKDHLEKLLSSLKEGEGNGSAGSQQLSQEREKSRLDSSSEMHSQPSDKLGNKKTGEEENRTEETFSRDSNRLLGGPQLSDPAARLLREPEIKGTRSGGGAGDGNTSDDDSVLFSGKYETSDQSLSQLSGGAGDFDYTEDAQQ